jgi:hypothetical protein
VLTVPAHRVKASLRSPLMIPRVALIDPLLTVSCPGQVDDIAAKAAVSSSMKGNPVVLSPAGLTAALLQAL